jgi:hypothetical protein
MEHICGNCSNWDTHDGLYGTCDEIRDAMGLTPLRTTGLISCVTKSQGSCTHFDTSAAAIQEEQAEAAYLADLNRGAGIDYPASLGV